MNATYAVERTWVPHVHAGNGVQERGGIVAREEVAVQLGERPVEQLVRPQQRHDRLEVAVGHVAHVEAHDRRRHRQHPPGRPALAADARQRRARRRARPGADRDVDPGQQHDAEDHEHEVERGDVVGIAQRHVDVVRCEQRRREGHERDDRACHERAPAQVAAAGLRTGRAAARAASPSACSCRARARQRQRPPRGARREAGQDARERERNHPDQHPAEVVGEVVPAEVDRRRRRADQARPERRLARRADSPSRCAATAAVK